MSVSLTVSDESGKIIDTFGKKRGLERKDAADRLLGIAETRYLATDKYAEENPPKRTPKARKPSKKTAKK
jgi:hypothetical protein